MRPALEKEISAVLLSFKRGHSGVNRWSADTARRLHKFLRGGKLLRGSLVIYAYRASGGRNTALAAKAGAALELLHAGLLIHDDIMDGDILRRGQLSLFAQYRRDFAGRADNALKLGQNLAICAADAAYFTAMALLAKAAEGSGAAGQLTALTGSEISKVCLAQMEDVFLGSAAAPLNEKRILDLYRHKTARYTFSLPFMMGALLAGGSPRLIALYEKMGENLGIVFQIKDDELGIFGSPEQTGKVQGSDIRENKKTLYYFYLIRQASRADHMVIKRSFGNPGLGKKDLAAIQRIILSNGAHDAVQRVSAKYHAKALAAIKLLPLKSQAKAELRGLAEYNFSRTA